MLLFPSSSCSGILFFGCHKLVVYMKLLEFVVQDLWLLDD